jgi:predicted O-linked N-acetylglucosamine transferase (SPINDLY family)
MSNHGEVRRLKQATEALAQGNALHMRGQSAEAIDAWIQAVRRDPGLTQALHNLVLGLIQSSRWPEAEKYSQQLVLRMPASVDAHAQRAIALWNVHRRDEAVQSLQRALELAPRRVDLYQQLTAFQVWSGRIADAAETMRRAAQQLPDDARVHAARGNLQAQLGRHADAVASLRRSLALDDSSAAAYTDLCGALRQLKQLDESAEAGLAAVRRDPRLVDAHYNLALVRHDQGLVGRMVASLRDALALGPAPRPHSSLLLALHYEQNDPIMVFEEHQGWDRTHAQPLLESGVAHSNDRSASRRLRIGYISPDFRRHPVAQFFEPILAHHNRSQFQITLYSDLLGGDAWTERIRGKADDWRPIAGVPDEVVARMVRQDQIDVLVELTGHTGFNRLLVLARKPAPVQVTYLGYVDTSGLTAIDYRFTDAWHDPPGATDHLHSEKLVRLDGGAWAFRPDDQAPDVSPLPASSCGQVTFLSPNKVAKVTDEMLRLWTQILIRVPDARLMIMTGGDRTGQARIRAGLNGIDPARVELLKRSGRDEYYQMYHRADIVLDTFPHNGHTTSVDALWMGLPVVTLAGHTHCARMGVSVLSSVGLEDLIGWNENEYVDKAVALASDRERLRDLRGGMRERMRRSGLMDGARLAREIEKRYLEFWLEWVRSPDRNLKSEIPISQTPHPIPLPEYGEREALRPNPESLVEAARQARDAGRFDEAERHLRAAVAAAPSVAKYPQYLGNFLWAQSKSDDAIEAWSAAVRLDASLTTTWHDLVGALFKAGRLTDDAIAALASSRPDEALARRQLAPALRQVGHLDQADAVIRQAIRLDRKHPEGHHILATVRIDQGLVREAVDAFRQALAIEPRAINTHSNLLLVLHFLPDVSPDAIYAEHRRWAHRFADPLLRQLASHGNDRSPDRRLRVGYLSADFRRHAVTMFFEPLLAAHDRANFEILLYSSVRKPDAVTDRLRASADGWRDVAVVPDEQLAQLIRDDRIDILVELTGHTDLNRLLVLARKPAPVQVAYLGYVDTTGMAAIDYRFTDTWHDPPGTTDHLHSETLMRLEGGAWAFRPDEDTPGVSPLPADAHGHVTFLSPNKVAKVTDEMLGLWARILADLPDARLMIVTGGDQAGQARIRAALGSAGLSRVELLGRTPRTEYYSIYHRADIVLDTFPHNGHTTSVDALWQGLPVITLAGTTHCSRMGVSVLSSIGLEDLICRSEDEYVAKAVTLANDRQRLRELRSGMRDRMSRSGLMDGARLAREIEKEYRQAWRRWLGVQARPALAPDQIVPTLESALAHYEANRLDKAEELFRDVLRASPDHPDALHLLGVVCMERGNLVEARQFVERATTVSPGSALFHLSLGNVHRAREDLPAAIDAWKRAAELDPGVIEAHANLAAAHAAAGDLFAAEQSWRQVLRIAPQIADAHLQLGRVLGSQKRFQDAIGSFETCLRLEPGNAAARSALAAAWHGLAVARRENGRLEEAEAAARRAVELAPDFAAAHHGLGAIEYDLGRIDDAVLHHRRAIELDPSDPAAHTALLLLLHYRHGDDGEMMREEHRRWAGRHADPLNTPAAAHRNSRDPDRVLRVGYVSGDLRDHPVAYFAEPLLAAHDRSRISISVYSNTPRADAFTERLRRSVDAWHEVRSLDDAQLAALIRQHAIDVLVDLSGHVANNRLLAFARKPAPVQVTYLGYPNTTGMRAMDYKLTDAWHDPPGLTEGFYVEQLSRLDGGAWCYRPRDEMPPVGPSPAESNGCVTFFSPNKFAKVTDAMLQTWRQLLLRCPKTRLLLLTGGDRAGASRVAAAMNGIDPERIEMIGRTSTCEYFNLLARADVALDTFPYNGHTTTCDALWMGVPVVTLAGRTHVSRAGVSVLSAAGLEELIAEDADGYLRIAESLAGGIDRVASLRRAMRQRVGKSPLLDGARLARAVEAQYRMMWHAWCRSSK